MTPVVSVIDSPDFGRYNRINNFWEEKPTMENKLNLPENFESYPEARKAGFMKMKELKDNGAKVVGMFCSFVPMELVYAAGALPVGLCAFTDEPIPAAEARAKHLAEIEAAKTEKAEKAEKVEKAPKAEKAE